MSQSRSDKVSITISNGPVADRLRKQEMRELSQSERKKADESKDRGAVSASAWLEVKVNEEYIERLDQVPAFLERKNVFFRKQQKLINKLQKALDQIAASEIKLEPYFDESYSPDFLYQAIRYLSGKVLESQEVKEIHKKLQESHEKLQGLVVGSDDYKKLKEEADKFKAAGDNKEIAKIRLGITNKKLVGFSLSPTKIRAEIAQCKNKLEALYGEIIEIYKINMVDCLKNELTNQNNDANKAEPVLQEAAKSGALAQPAKSWWQMPWAFGSSQFSNVTKSAMSVLPSDLALELETKPFKPFAYFTKDERGKKFDELCEALRISVHAFRNVSKDLVDKADLLKENVDNSVPELANKTKEHLKALARIFGKDINPVEEKKQIEKIETEINKHLEIIDQELNSFDSSLAASATSFNSETMGLLEKNLKKINQLTDEQFLKVQILFEGDEQKSDNASIAALEDCTSYAKLSKRLKTLYEVFKVFGSSIDYSSYEYVQEAGEKVASKINELKQKKGLVESTLNALRPGQLIAKDYSKHLERLNELSLKNNQAVRALQQTITAIGDQCLSGQELNQAKKDELNTVISGVVVVFHEMDKTLEPIKEEQTNLRKIKSESTVITAMRESAEKQYSICEKSLKETKKLWSQVNTMRLLVDRFVPIAKDYAEASAKALEIKEDYSKIENLFKEYQGESFDRDSDKTHYSLANLTAHVNQTTKTIDDRLNKLNLCNKEFDDNNTSKIKADSSFFREKKAEEELMSVLNEGAQEAEAKKLSNAAILDTLRSQSDTAFSELREINARVNEEAKLQSKNCEHLKIMVSIINNVEFVRFYDQAKDIENRAKTLKKQLIILNNAVKGLHNNADSPVGEIKAVQQSVSQLVMEGSLEQAQDRLRLFNKKKVKIEKEIKSLNEEWGQRNDECRELCDHTNKFYNKCEQKHLGFIKKYLSNNLSSVTEEKSAVIMLFDQYKDSLERLNKFSEIIKEYKECQEQLEVISSKCTLITENAKKALHLRKYLSDLAEQGQPNFLNEVKSLEEKLGSFEKAKTLSKQLVEEMDALKKKEPKLSPPYSLSSEPEANKHYEKNRDDWDEKFANLANKQSELKETIEIGSRQLAGESKPFIDLLREASKIAANAQRVVEEYKKACVLADNHLIASQTLFNQQSAILNTLYANKKSLEEACQRKCKEDQGFLAVFNGAIKELNANIKDAADLQVAASNALKAKEDNIFNEINQQKKQIVENIRLNHFEHKEIDVSIENNIKTLTQYYAAAETKDFCKNEQAVGLLKDFPEFVEVSFELAKGITQLDKNIKETIKNIISSPGLEIKDKQINEFRQFSEAFEGLKKRRSSIAEPACESIVNHIADHLKVLKRSKEIMDLLCSIKTGTVAQKLAEIIEKRRAILLDSKSGVLEIKTAKDDAENAYNLLKEFCKEEDLKPIEKKLTVIRSYTDKLIDFANLSQCYRENAIFYQQVNAELGNTLVAVAHYQNTTALYIKNNSDFSKKVAEGGGVFNCIYRSYKDSEFENVLCKRVIDTNERAVAAGNAGKAALQRVLTAIGNTEANEFKKILDNEQAKILDLLKTFLLNNAKKYEKEVRFFGGTTLEGTDKKVQKGLAAMYGIINNKSLTVDEKFNQVKSKLKRGYEKNQSCCHWFNIFSRRKTNGEVAKFYNSLAFLNDKVAPNYEKVRKALGIKEKKELLIRSPLLPKQR